MREPSIMARKFRELAKREDIYYESFELNPLKFFFFYDTLMDPGQLASVLQLGDTEGPVTRPALITRYSRKMWGSYPTTIEPGEYYSRHGVRGDFSTYGDEDCEIPVL
jgi:hypothetical protein